MPTVCVLGANSFSGQDFIDLLVEKTDYSVHGVARSHKDTLFLNWAERAQWRLTQNAFSICDLNKHLEGFCEFLDELEPEYVVNFAALSEVAPSWEHPEQWFETNTVALAKLVNYLRKQTWLKKYLHISSPEVYGSCWGIVTEDAPLNPSTPYAASKAAADLLLSTYQKQYGFPLVTVRSTNVFGPRQQLWKLIPRTIINIKQQRKLQLHGGGRAIKSWIHIRDVSNGELAILLNGRVGEIYHLSPAGGTITVRDTVQHLAALFDKELSEVAEDVAERPGQDAAYVISSRKARAELDWAPKITLSDGLDEVVQWVNGHWTEIQQQPLEYQHRP